MNAELEAIKEKWEEEPRDYDATVALADQYVADHPDEFSGYEERPIEDLVASLDVFRAANDQDNQWRVQAWLFHRFQPQNIGGTYQPQIRIPGGAE